MQKLNTRFSLKLSRETIQLFLTNDLGQFEEIGSADPNNIDIDNDLNILRKQVHALTGQKPLIDVMLPEELILVQNLNITAYDKPVSIEDALELVSNTCDLDRNEVNVAIGSPTSPRTQPVAAVTTKTLNETRYFLNNAGFEINQFMASEPMIGFLEPPVFSEASTLGKPYLSNKNITTVGGILTACVLFFSALILFTQTFKHSEIPRQFRQIITVDIPAKIPSYSDQYIENQYSFSPMLPPNFESNQTQKLQKVTNEEFFTKKTFSKNIIVANFDSRNVLNQLYKEAPKLSEESDFKSNNQVFLSKPPSKNLPSVFYYLPNYLRESSLLNKYTKLQNLRSSIQTDYLKSVQTGFDSSEVEANIKTIHALKSPNYQRNKLLEIPSALVEPELSFLQKNQHNLLTWPKTSELKFMSKPTEVINKKLLFLENGDRTLEAPQLFSKEDKLIKDQNYQNLVKFGFKRLTPNEILLSKKYQPIFRPNLISKLNVLTEPTLSSGAITLSRNPIARPQSFTNLSQIDASQVKIIAKATRKPSFPRRASIVNNATITNIMELNRTNLIGVFGTKQNAIALIRLSSGRIIKVRVGDRFSGWRVLTIYEDKIELANGNKQETLRLPG